MALLKRLRILFVSLIFIAIIFYILAPINYSIKISKYLVTDSPKKNDATDYRFCYKKNKSTIIFLHVTNTSDAWNPLEMCTFKTASIMNPKTGVCVLTKSKMKIHPALSFLSNLEIAPLNISLLVVDTPLFNWYEEYRNETTRSRVSAHPMMDLSDALRLVYIYKYGGKYMDTDMWTLKNLDHLQNVAGMVDNQIAGHVLFFEHGHPFMKEAVENFNIYFTPGYWGGLAVLLYRKVHNSGRIDRKTYKVLPQYIFDPIHYTQPEPPFAADKNEFMKSLINRSYTRTIHLYRAMLKQYWQLDWQYL